MNCLKRKHARKVELCTREQIYESILQIGPLTSLSRMQWVNGLMLE